MTTYLDYSGGRPKGATIRADGHSGVIRYVTSPDLAATKHITPAEYADLVAAGVDVLLVYEGNTQDMQGGHAAGVANMGRAVAGAHWIGYPTDKPIFLAADRHATAAENAAHWPAWQQYLDGGASVVGKALVGAYGFSEAIDAATGHASWFWQCGSQSVLRPQTHLYQRNTGTTVVGGIGCDINDLIHPITQEDEVTPQDKQDIINGVIGAMCGKAGDWTGTLLGTGIANIWAEVCKPGGNGHNLTAIQGQLAALQAAVAGLAEDSNVSADSLKAMIDDAVAQHISLTGTVQITGDQAPAAPAPGAAQ